MSNLTNVYAYLRENSLDVDVLLIKPISYIQTLVNIDDQKVILIYKEVI